MAGLINFDHLTRSQRKLYLAACAGPHDVNFKVDVLDNDESPEHGIDISAHVQGGSVTLDRSSDPDRNLSLDLLDPDYRLETMDAHHAFMGGLWAGSVLRVWMEVFVEDIGASGKWVEKAVFTGPVTGFSDSGGGVLNVTAEGKESFLLPPNAYSQVFSNTEIAREGKTRKHAMQALLDAIGEPQPLRWHGTEDNLPKDFNALKVFHLGELSYLKLAHAICGSANFFYYDGYGRPTVRRSKASPAYDLTDVALTDAATATDVATIRNRAHAVVRHKPPIDVTVTTRDSDPTSAKSLGRTGVKRYRDADKMTATFKTKDAALDAGRKALNGVEAQSRLDIVPVPFLEPGDRVRVFDDRGRRTSFRCQQWTMPLSAGDSMSLGYNRKMLDPRHAVARFHIRQKKHGKKAKK